VARPIGELPSGFAFFDDRQDLLVVNLLHFIGLL
jgi:hypothetical protein